MDCWIKHDLDGLLSGTLLRAEDGRGWRVLHRQLWRNAAGLHRRFPNETENWGHMSFALATDYEDGARGIADAEERDGFEYFVEPLGHDQKPEDGLLLHVEEVPDL